MIKTIYLFFFVCVFSLGLWACSSKKEAFKNLDCTQFETLIKDPSVQLVDTRTLAEYNEGHIPGSIHIDVLDEENFPLHVDELLNKGQTVAVYCRSGRRSRNAAELLVKKGFKVYNLDKGILNWTEEGREIEK